jgi:hypothetical protein
MKKAIVLAALLAAPAPAFAHVQCAGETFSNIVVTVDVKTQGTFGPVQGATVTITPKDGRNVRSYSVDSREIPQFFASTDGDNNERAIVGMSAFVNQDNPVYIRFVGTNRTDDLIDALRDKARAKEARNTLRVWKGPGYGSDQQHSFKDVVCSVQADL